MPKGHTLPKGMAPIARKQANGVRRKLHLAVDDATGEIVASDLTSRRTRDLAQVPNLLGHPEGHSVCESRGRQRRVHMQAVLQGLGYNDDLQYQRGNRTKDDQRNIVVNKGRHYAVPDVIVLAVGVEAGGRPQGRVGGRRAGIA